MKHDQIIGFIFVMHERVKRLDTYTTYVYFKKIQLSDRCFLGFYRQRQLFGWKKAILELFFNAAVPVQKTEPAHPKLVALSDAHPTLHFQLRQRKDARRRGRQRRRRRRRRRRLRCLSFFLYRLFV